MLLTKKLWKNNFDLALMSLETKFIKGIKTGELPRKIFQDYVAQDSYFLKSFAKAYQLAIPKSPNTKCSILLSKLLKGVKDELVLHETYAKNWNINLKTNSLQDSTKKYTEFLEHSSLNQSCIEILCAMTPCMRLYAWLGKKLEKDFVDNPYKEWIMTYAHKDFENLAQSLENLIDTNDELLDIDNANYLYKEAMILELEFFQTYSIF